MTLTLAALAAVWAVAGAVLLALGLSKRYGWSHAI